jgi:hypothetical protein
MAAKKKRLGALETPGFVLGPGFFEPLPESELFSEETLTGCEAANVQKGEAEIQAGKTHSWTMVRNNLSS